MFDQEIKVATFSISFSGNEEKQKKQKQKRNNENKQKRCLLLMKPEKDPVMVRIAANNNSVLYECEKVREVERKRERKRGDDQTADKVNRRLLWKLSSFQ